MNTKEWTVTITPLTPDRARGQSDMVRVVAVRGPQVITTTMSAEWAKHFDPNTWWDGRTTIPSDRLKKGIRR